MPAKVARPLRPDELRRLKESELSYRKLAAKHRLAYMSGSRDATAAGGLVSMAANFPELYERAAFYVDKILKARNPLSFRSSYWPGLHS